MAKGFIIALKKDEYNDSRYKFFNMEQIDCDTNTIITKGKTFGYKLDVFKSSQVINLDASRSFKWLASVFNNPKSSGDVKLELAQPIYTENKEWLFIKIDATFITNLQNMGCKTPQSLVSKLYEWFANLENFELLNDFSWRNGSIGLEGKNALKAHRLPASECKEITAEEINRILTEGIKEFAENTSSRAPASAANPSIGKVSISQLDPDDIIDKLRKKIVGQDKFIQDVVDTMFMNQEVIDTGDPNLLKTHKANIFIDGPTGTGKTFLMEELCNHLSLPMVIVSATSFSTVGYKGADLESVLIQLLDAAGGNLELAERGVIALDEFDKLGNNNQHNELAIRKGIQEELLTYLSGAKFRIRYKDKDIDFDTSKITFVAMGAFTNLRKRKIAEKDKNSSSINGFGASLKSRENDEDRTYIIEHKDYVEEGIMEELIGRFTTLTNTKAWTKKSLVMLMKTSDASPLIGTQKLVSYKGKTLETSDDVLELIAELALEMSTGARALSVIFNPITRALMRKIRSKDEAVITLSPELVSLVKEQRRRSY